MPRFASRPVPPTLLGRTRLVCGRRGALRYLLGPLGAAAFLATPVTVAWGQVPTSARATDTAAGAAPSSRIRPVPQPGAPTARAALLGLPDSLLTPRTYEREVFTYPTFGRTDPVSPPAVVLAADAFPDLWLTAILYDEARPAQSRAIVRVAGRRSPNDRVVVRAGDRIDQYRVARVERTQVSIDKIFLGSTERMVLTQMSRAARAEAGNTTGGAAIDIPAPRSATTRPSPITRPGASSPAVTPLTQLTSPLPTRSPDR